MFINYAHRGASEYYPENTLSAFYAGLDMGANGGGSPIPHMKPTRPRWRKTAFVASLRTCFISRTQRDRNEGLF